MIETVDKDDLCEITRAVELMQFTAQGLMEEYFHKFKRDKKDDHWKIVWEFERNRARAEIISDYLRQVEKMLEELGITYC